jgi:hypothetical protein
MCCSTSTSSISGMANLCSRTSLPFILVRPTHTYISTDLVELVCRRAALLFTHKVGSQVCLVEASMCEGIDHRVQGRAADRDGPQVDLQLIIADASPLGIEQAYVLAQCLLTKPLHLAPKLHRLAMTAVEGELLTSQDGQRGALFSASKAHWPQKVWLH